MEETLDKLIKTIIDDFPETFKIIEAEAKYPFEYNESMNTVLT